MVKLGFCGIDCNKCEYKEKCNCPTCHEAKGEMFWGKCPVAECNINKKFENCSKCNDFPCELLNKFAFDKEQGDNGQRIENLRELLS